MKTNQTMHRRNIFGRGINKNKNNNTDKEISRTCNNNSIKRKENQNNNNNKLSAIIVVGEASESDDDGGDDDCGQIEVINDDGDITGGAKQTLPSTVIDYHDDFDEQKSIITEMMAETNSSTIKNYHENSEDDQYELLLCKQSKQSSNNNFKGVTTIKRPISIDSMTVSTTMTDCHRPQNNSSLLHSLLSESNEHFKENLIKLSCSPYLMAEIEYSHIIRQLLSTQKLLQTNCQLLNTIGDDLNELDKSFITLSKTLLATNNNKLLSKH